MYRELAARHIVFVIVAPLLIAACILVAMYPADCAVTIAAPASEVSCNGLVGNALAIREGVFPEDLRDALTQRAVLIAATASVVTHVLALLVLRARTRRTQPV